MKRAFELGLLALAALTIQCGGAGRAATAPEPRGPDPTATDGDKYQVILENQDVRVLRYHDEPGAKTHLHQHPDFVMVALAPFRRQLTFADGTTRVRDFKGGEVAWMPAQSHVGENVGTTATDVLLVEMKRR